MEFVQSLFATPYGAFMAMIAVMVLGEYIAKLSKGYVPQALTATVVLLTLFWTGVFPANIANNSGASATVFGLVAALLIVNMGTLINRKQMVAQWRTVVIAILGICGIIAICLTIGAALFGFENAVAAAPPLTGAAMATAMVRQAAEAVGNSRAALIAVVCMSMQGIFGYPLTALCLKKEAQSLVQQFRAGTLKLDAVEGEEAAKAAKPESTNLVLLKLSFLAVISYLIQQLTAKMGFSISMYVWALFLGFIAHEIGFIQYDCLTKANAYGLCITFLMLYLFGGVAGNDFQTVMSAAGTAAALVALSACGMAIIAVICGKIFKKSFWMSFAITLNAFLGFPVNVMLVNEALDINTKTPEERAVVSAQLMPPMLVGSFVCVTIVSVIVAGVLIKFIV